jgi:hypothetical protein
MRWRSEEEAKEGGGDGMRGNVEEQWRRERDRERGSENEVESRGYKSQATQGLGRKASPCPCVPYEFPKCSLILPFLGFTSCQGALKSFHICDPIFLPFHFLVSLFIFILFFIISI